MPTVCEWEGSLQFALPSLCERVCERGIGECEVVLISSRILIVVLNYA